MKLEEQKIELESLVEQHNQATEQIQMLQSSVADLRMQIANKQGVVQALESVQKGKKDAKT
jgi:prefoldin subunit 5